MPVPKPRKGERSADFLSRCIQTLSERDPYRPRDQIIAMCYDALRRSGRKVKKKKRT